MFRDISLRRKHKHNVTCMNGVVYRKTKIDFEVTMDDVIKPTGIHSYIYSISNESKCTVLVFIGTHPHTYNQYPGPNSRWQYLSLQWSGIVNDTVSPLPGLQDS